MKELVAIDLDLHIFMITKAHMAIFQTPMVFGMILVQLFTFVVMKNQFKDYKIAAMDMNYS